MKYVLTVTFDLPAEVLLPAVAGKMQAHLTRMRDFHARGVLLMSGPISAPREPLETLGVFTTQEAAQEFADGDPFIVAGTAQSWRIRPWSDILQAVR